MVGMRNRFAWLAMAGAGFAITVGAAAPAHATISTPPTPASVANTQTGVSVSVVTSTQPTLLLAPMVELKGPGAGTDTYDGTNTTVAGVPAHCVPVVTCTGSKVTSTFDLDVANLPAGPGTYTLSVCTVSCAVPSSDTTSLTVTGDPPAPVGTASPVVVGTTGSTSVAMLGTGFAKGDTVVATGASGVSFAPSSPQGTATELDGTITTSGAPAGIYDLMVTDTAGQTGTCGSCLIIQAPSVTNPTLTAVDPATVSTDRTDPVSLTGTGFANGMTVTLSNSTAATGPVDSTLTSATAAAFMLPADVAAGGYDVTLTNPDTGTVTKAGGLTVQPPPTPTTLTLGASSKKVAYGDAVTLSGDLTESGEGMAKQPVDLFAKPDTGHTTLLTTLKTDATGHYVFDARPAANTTYYTYFPGNSGEGASAGDKASVSDTAPRVKVAPVVIAKAKTPSVHTKPLVVSGHVRPVAAGRSVYLVVVKFGGHKHLISTTTVKPNSHFRFKSAQPTRRGRFTIEVLIHHSPGMAKAASAPLTVKRT
jgi:hypothetical protein